MDTMSALPVAALLPAAAAVALILLFRQNPGVRDAWSVLAAVAQTAIVAAMLPAVLDGRRLVWQSVELAPGVPVSLRADALGLLFAGVASTLWILTTLYSIGYVRALREHAQTRYFASFALCLLATVGLALAGNLLTFFVFFELLTVAAYPLVVHRETRAAALAGKIYLVYTLTGGTALLGAVAWTATVAGRLDFAPGGILPADTSTATLWGLFALFLVGCGVKAALIPFHTWLPVAMVAPTPVSALLHAVAVVKAGVFGFLRVTGFVFGPDLLRDLGAATLLAWLAMATILLASLVALVQDDLKRLLAFSTVGQLSYIVLGAALGTPTAMEGGVLHIASHAVLKITLFFCVGAIHVATHRERASELGGVGRRMPVTMTAFALAAFMLAGLPPGVGFVSKWRLLMGASEASAWLAVGTLLASTVLNLGYFVPIVVRAFTASSDGGRAEAPMTMIVPLAITALAGLALGLFPDGAWHLLTLARAVAAGAGGGP
jgi:multicomponent Na+:H+ antiporter subunit D